MTSDKPEPLGGQAYEVLGYCNDMINQVPDDRDKRSIISYLAEQQGWTLQPSTKPLKTVSKKRSYKMG